MVKQKVGTRQLDECEIFTLRKLLTEVDGLPKDTVIKIGFYRQHGPDVVVDEAIVDQISFENIDGHQYITLIG